MTPQPGQPPWSPVIDTHAHVFLPEHAPQGMHKPPPAYGTTADQYLALLKQHGIAYGVLTAPSFMGTYNGDVLDALAQHKNLRGTAIIDARTDRAALRELMRAGIVGVRYSLRGVNSMPDFEAAEFKRLFKDMAELDCFVHVLAESEHLAVLIPALAKTGVKLVIDHFGLADSRAGVADPGLAATLTAIDNGRTWVKLCAPYRMKSCVGVAPLAQRLLAVAGTERLVWGSDWPFISHETQATFGQTLDWFSEWIPDRTMRQAIGHTGMALHRCL